MKWKKTCYDLEVYRNLFTATFYLIDSDEWVSFEISERKNERESLIQFIEEGDKYLIGYNNKGYDDIILNYLIDGKNFNKNSWRDICQKMYDMSQVVIGVKQLWLSKDLKSFLYTKRYKSLDLMLIHRFHKLGVSLKQVAISLKWHRIQDLPIPFNAFIQKDQIDLILLYNKNDVGITNALYEESLPEIKLRQSITKKYGVNVMNSSRPNIADKLMNRFYSDKTGLDYREFRDLRDNDTTVQFKDIIWDKIQFQTEPLKELMKELKATTVVAEKGNKDFRGRVVLNDCVYDVAKGGLHSDMQPGMWEEDEQHILIDLDFGSFYPNIMLQLGLYPPQLGPEFLEILEMITTQRLEAKANGDKVTSDALKITINSIYGKLGFEHGYLYSPKTMYSVTINGQLIPT